MKSAMFVQLKIILQAMNQHNFVVSPNALEKGM